MPRPKKPPPDAKRCTHKGAKGRCPNVRQKDDVKCFTHSAKRAKERKAARVKGGKNAHKPIATVDAAAAKLAFKRSMDVVDALEEVFDEVRKGKLDYRIGQTLGVLGATMLKALQVKEADDQDARIAGLEERLEKMRKVGRGTNENGKAAKAGEAGADLSGSGRGRHPEGAVPGWLPDDEAGGDEAGPLAGEDAAEPLW